MGFFNRNKGRSKSMEDPVRGEAKVITAYDRHESEALLTRVPMRLSVWAEGLEPTTVEWKGMVAAHKWPRAGTVLPVTVDRANPEKVEIHWDEAPNLVQQWLPGTEASLTADQRELMEDQRARAANVNDELQEAVRRWKAGEISMEELTKRQDELMGGSPSGPSI